MSGSPGAQKGPSAAPAPPPDSAAAGEGADRRTGRETSAAPPEWLGALKSAGPVVAWIAAVACGWQAAAPAWESPSSGQSSDLLSAVLHGAGAWLGVLVVWIGGVSACERLLLAMRPAAAEGETEAETAEERR